MNPCDIHDRFIVLSFGLINTGAKSYRKNSNSKTQASQDSNAKRPHPARVARFCGVQHHGRADEGEKIWRVLTHPDAFARWLPPNGFTAHVYEMNVKVGGTYRMSFTR